MGLEVSMRRIQLLEKALLPSLLCPASNKAGMNISPPRNRSPQAIKEEQSKEISSKTSFIWLTYSINMLSGKDGKYGKDGKDGTNSTLEESYRARYVLVDTGFSGDLVIGNEILSFARRATTGILRKILAPPSRATRYIFGAGKGVDTIRRVLLSLSMLGTALCDVVPGKLPLLAIVEAIESGA